MQGPVVAVLTTSSGLFKPVLAVNQCTFLIISREDKMRNSIAMNNALSCNTLRCAKQFFKSEKNDLKKKMPFKGYT